MFSIRWVIRLYHLLIFDRLMLTITVYVERRSGDVEIDNLITNSTDVFTNLFSQFLPYEFFKPLIGPKQFFLLSLPVEKKILTNIR